MTGREIALEFGATEDQAAEKDAIFRAKLVILYVLEYFNLPLTREQFLAFMSEERLINIFLLQKYTDELIEVQQIEESQSEGETYIFNTERGSEAVALFASNIPQVQRRKINDAIDEHKKSFNSWTKITANFAKTDDHEYRVELSISEGPYKLFSMDMNALTNKTAKQLCGNWEDNARFLYGDLLQILMPPVPDGLCISDFLNGKSNDRTNNCAEYQQLEEGEYSVMLSISEADYKLMSIELSVLAEKDAEFVCEYWKSNARQLYSNLLKALTPEKKEDDKNEGQKQ